MMMSSNDKTSLTNEHDQQEEMNNYGYQDETNSGSGFSCFGFFCFDRHRWSLLHGGEQREETWLIKKTKIVKEFSEVVAGPKWKNFIRKLGKYCNTKKSRMAECRQYDPQSYALNFDDGFDDDDDLQEENNNSSLGGFSTKVVLPRTNLQPDKTPSEDFSAPSFSLSENNMLGIGMNSMVRAQKAANESANTGSLHLSKASSLGISLNNSREGSPDKNNSDNTLPMLLGMPPSAAKLLCNSTTNTTTWISTAQLGPHAPVFAAWTDA